MTYDCWFQRDYPKALTKSMTASLGILYFYFLLKLKGHKQWLLTASWCHTLKLGLICGLFSHALCSIKQILLRIIAGKITGNSHPSPNDPNHIYFYILHVRTCLLQFLMGFESGPMSDHCWFSAALTLTLVLLSTKTHSCVWTCTQ